MVHGASSMMSIQFLFEFGKILIIIIIIVIIIIIIIINKRHQYFARYRENYVYRD